MVCLAGAARRHHRRYRRLWLPTRHRGCKTIVQFEFKEISRDNLGRASAGQFPDPLVDWCYAENSDKAVPVPHACGETMAQQLSFMP